MRCTFKVAYRDGLTKIERRTPYSSGDDGKATSALMCDLVEAWDRYESSISEFTKDAQTKKAVNSVSRAFRYDSWVYVRLEVKGFMDRKSGKYKMMVDVSMSDPNKANELEVAEGRRMARELASLILVRREISLPDLKERIVYDRENEFFKWAETSPEMEFTVREIAAGNVKRDSLEAS